MTSISFLPALYTFRVRTETPLRVATAGTQLEATPAGALASDVSCVEDVSCVGRNIFVYKTSGASLAPLLPEQKKPQ
jgi:hypothetical protein